MKRVVSVSLGSSKRDKSSTLTLMGEDFEISRVGVDGDMNRFAELVREFDGKVDAIGMGGIDRYLWTHKKRYTVRDADRLAANAKVTPVVDGSGVKNTLERRTIEYLQHNGIVDFTQSKVLIVCSVDRFGMAQVIAELSPNVIYGDLLFSCGIPMPLKSYAAITFIARLLLPIIVRLPFKWLYPTGDKQESITPKHQKYYRWADVVAGDFHLIRRTLPTPESGLLKGKVVVTNTITEDDRRLLAERGVRLLVTSTPEYDGRFYATNVIEGMFVALLGKRPDQIAAEDYDDLLKQMNWRPTLTYLSQPDIAQLAGDNALRA